MTLESNELEAFKQLMEERDKRYEERFLASEKMTALALTASKEAVNKAEIATEKRFDAVNEFRGQLKDQAATLMPRVETDSKFRALEDKIEEIKRERQSQSRFDLRTILTLVALAVSIAAIFFRK